MRIVCWQTILMKYLNLFFPENLKDVEKFVVCCSRDWLFKGLMKKASLTLVMLNILRTCTRPGAKYFEKYSNTLQLLWLINDYNYITITGPVEM